MKLSALLLTAMGTSHITEIDWLVIAAYFGVLLCVAWWVVRKGKDSAAFYTSGAGTYTLSDSMYTEHLEYCSDRAWEGHDFVFTVAFQNDMLTQTGIESQLCERKNDEPRQS